MKKFALFAMLLCSGVLFGCTKPKETKPTEKPATTETKEKGTDSVSTPAEPAPSGGGEATK
jgi:hypothetical protein